MLQIGIGLVKENETKIQPIINDFSNSTVSNLLENKQLTTKSTNLVDGILKSGNLNDGLINQTNAVLTSDSVRATIANVAAGTIDNKNFKNTLSNTITTDPVLSAIGISIRSALFGPRMNS